MQKHRVVSDGTLRNVCPVDLRPLPPVAVSTEAQVRTAVQAARGAQPGWAALGFEARAKLLRQAARRMLERRQEVLELLHDEIGKPPAEVLMSEALGPLDYVKNWIKVARPYLAPRKLPVSRLAFPGKSGHVDVVPRGVVAIIAPWNFPLANFFKPVLPALLCGNAVVIKPSEHSPRTGAWFASVLNDFLPPHVLQCVQGDGVVGNTLVRSGIDAVTFTGSVRSGREVVRAAAEALIPCSVELGGKDAAIILADCDLDRTVAGVMNIALANAGQACGAIERVYVVDAIADRFADALSKAVARLRVHSGDPSQSDVGPLANPMQLAVVEAQVADAVEQGAQVLCGGKRTGKGLWFEPTVLDRCTHAMKAMTEETFGPLIPLMRVRDAAEAVRWTNALEVGLNASVWSKDIQRAEEIARQLEVGTALINNHGITGAMAAAPWTGVKGSGYGIANSAYALGHFTRPRTTLVDRNRGPDLWWYPVDEVLEELGHRLADAQLGKFSSALKIPLLLRQRSRQILELARSTAPYRVTELHPKPPQVTGFRAAIDRVRVAITTLPQQLGLDALPVSDWMRMTPQEKVWGRAILETIYPASSDARLPTPLTTEQIEAFLSDLVKTFPPVAALGLRGAILTVALAPVFTHRKLTTFDRLSESERVEVIEAFSASNIYLIRQMAMLLKTGGALSVTSTTRFRKDPNPRPHAVGANLRSIPIRPVAEA